MQINVRIGAGAVVAFAAVVAAGVWWADSKGLLPVSKRPPDIVVKRAPKDLEVIPTNGGLLVIAQIKGYEVFERRSPSVLDVELFKVPLPFGDTVSEIRTAALYGYQIRMEKRWPVRCSPEECVVQTGPVELAEPVAIYYDETERKTRSGWARFDKAANLEALNRELGRALVVRGKSERNRDAGLRDGRKTIQRFVSEWLQKETGGKRTVLVLYPGETEAQARKASQAAAL